MLPFGAQGANMGIFSALELANRFFDMETNSQDEITSIFEEYYEVRHKPAQWFVDYSNGVGDLLHRKVDTHAKCIWSPASSFTPDPTRSKRCT